MFGQQKVRLLHQVQQRHVPQRVGVGLHCHGQQRRPEEDGQRDLRGIPAQVRKHRRSHTAHFQHIISPALRRHLSHAQRLHLVQTVLQEPGSASHELQHGDAEKNLFDMTRNLLVIGPHANAKTLTVCKSV